MAMPRRVFFVDSFHDPVLNVPDVSETKHRLFFLLYLSLAMVMLSLLSVVTLIPLWIQEIRHLETAGGHEIASVLKQTEVAWSSLLQMQSDTPTISWARLRRQTNDDFYYNGDSDPYRKESVVSASYKVKNYYQAEPTCCCPDLASNPGLIDTLPVSSACPKGPRGPPGQRGPIGEPGMSGLPGRPGFSSADGNGGDFFEHPYDQIFISQQQQMPRICEPCPYGPSGQPGGKGRPGPTGPRGVPGSPGKHGHHGYPGSVGPTGDMGPRGRPGQPGLPGAEGLPGFKRAVGRPGAKGNRGDSGAQGIRGPTGQRGTPGNPGTMGRPGPPGIRGQRGLDGVDGAMGGSGRPGTDGFYCQCPPRSIAVERPAYALAERKIVHMPTTQPPENYARNVYSYSQDAKPEAYGIPLATTRHFGRASPPLPTPPPIYHTADEYDENGFMGKDTFLKTVQRPSISYSMDFVDETRDRKSA